MGICYIIGAMESAFPFQPKAGDCIIAADGGYRHLRAAGLKPDLVVGDFDSLGYVPEGEEIVRHPVRKDDTDTMLAVKLGLARGYDRFLLLGGLGGRLDHTIANLHALAYLMNHGARGCLMGKSESAILFRDRSVFFYPEGRETVSVFAYGGIAMGVSLEGLEYPLTNAVLTPGFPLGVSNAFTGAPAKISVEQGCLLVIWQDGIDRTDWLEV